MRRLEIAEKISYHTGWILAVLVALLGLAQVYVGIQFQRTTTAVEADVYTWLGGGLVLASFLLFLWWFYSVRPRL